MNSKRVYSGNPGAGSAVERLIESSIDRVKLPKPDLKNITALTRNLPNSPILPWNHYDSPQQAETSDKTSEPGKPSPGE